MDDPSCALRGFETFFEYAWIAMIAIAGFLLAGWAMSLLRGANTKITTNLLNLSLIFVVLSATKPAMKLIYNGDLFEVGCRTISVPIKEVDALIKARKEVLKEDLYEVLEVSAPMLGEVSTELEDVELPEPGSGAPVVIDVDESLLNPNTVFSEDGSMESQMLDIEIPYDSDGTGAAGAYESSGNSVVYIMPDGSKVKRTGGSIAWRNNNPGNIRYRNTEFYRKLGLVGSADGFAVFADEESGMRAIEALLRTKNYNNKTIAGAIERYSPPSENDTYSYQRHVQKFTGLPIDKKMSSLTAEELRTLVKAIRHKEGWTVGTEQRIE
jgi:hypothetical protein